MSANAKSDRSVGTDDRSIQSIFASDFTEKLPLVTLSIDSILAEWLVRKVTAGFGGTQKEVEILAATLILTEEELLGKIPPPWIFSEKPLDYFLRFAEESKFDPESAIQFWQQVKAFPEGFKELQKPRPIRKILVEVEQLRGKKGDESDVVDEVQALVSYSQEIPDIENLLPSQLLTAFFNFSKRLNIQSFALIGVLLPVAASLLPVGTRIEIDSATDFYPPSILWTGLVAESGAAKSPNFDTILKPLEKLQAETDQHHQQEYEDYEQSLIEWERSKDERGSKPKPPVPKEFYFQDTTIEALAEAISKQPERGVIQAVDELAGFINSLNQYKPTGKGSDRQKWLSAYDGRGIKVNRKGGEKTEKRLSIPRTAISLTGTIQPSTLRRLMGNLEEVDGLWSRFCWIRIPLALMPPPSNGGRFNLGEMLYALYRNLSKFEPLTYRLDKEGRLHWREWHIWTEQEKLNEPHPAVRAIYPKARERAARIALVAHCLKAAFEGEAPTELVASSTLEAAIAFTRWTIGQARIVYADVGVAEDEDSARILRFVERFRETEWISRRDVQRWYPRKPQIKADEAEGFMAKVVRLGYAVSNGEAGRNFQVKICTKAPDIPDIPAQISTNQGIDSPDNLLDTTPTLPDKETADSEDFEPVRECQETVSSTVRKANSSSSKALTSTVRNVSQDLQFVRTLKPGDRVVYRGSRYPVYSGLELVITSIEGGQVTCRKPDGRFTTQLDFSDLEASAQTP